MSTEKASTPAPRLPLRLDVEYRRSYSRSSAKGTLKNISLTGAFLEIFNIEDIMPKDKLLITLHVGGRERILPATIIWQCRFGCGVKFMPANNRDIQIVDDLMYFVETSRTNQREVLDSIFKKVA